MRDQELESPAPRDRKRQRRITAGGKPTAVAAPPPCNNAAASRPQRSQRLSRTAATSEQEKEKEAQAADQVAAQRAAQQEAAAAEEEEEVGQLLDLAWQEYLGCAGQPALWAFLKASQPAGAIQAMHRYHPSAIFPDHYPHALPPSVAQLPPVQAPAPVLRPAGSDMPELPAAPLQQQPQQELPRLVPAAEAAAAGQAGGDQVAAQAGPGDATEAGSEDAAASGSEQWSDDGSSLYQDCWCADCQRLLGSTLCTLYSCSPYSSTRVQPGRCISWRGSLPRGDPVRRNLMSALLKEAPQAPAAGPAAGMVGDEAAEPAALTTAAVVAAAPSAPALRPRRRQ